MRIRSSGHVRTSRRWAGALVAGAVAVAMGLQGCAADARGTSVATATGALPWTNQCVGLDDRHRAVETRHRVELASGPLTYTARAGLMPLREHETSETLAHIAYMAYTIEPTPGAPPRPVMFLWNGGPGAPSSPLHLTGVGPKIIEMSAVPDGSRPADPRFVPNDGTWLEFTDLVFVDPVGTGYSRATRPEYREEFWSGRGDIQSIAEFIRLYLVHYDAWDAPLFVTGQSYGAGRAAGMLEVLPARGISIAGAILISGVFLSGDGTLRRAAVIPSFTATAFAHHRLDAELMTDLETTLRESERWARTVYAPALRAIEELTPGVRSAVAEDLARFTGVDAAVLASQDLQLTTGLFTRMLLADEGRVVGRYDGRLTAPLVETEGPYDPTTDPSLQSHFPPGRIERYLAHELGFGCDRVYAGPFGGFWPATTEFRGDWMTMRWTRTPETAVDPAGAVLDRVLASSPAPRMFIVMGRHDLVTPYFAAELEVERLQPSAQQNAAVLTYTGGHSPYHDLESRLRLKADIETFIRGAAEAERRTGGRE